MLIGKFGASPNDADSLTCLHQAARYVSMETVKLLTSYPQCDIDHKNKYMYCEREVDLAKYGQRPENADFLTTLSEQRTHGASTQPASAAAEAVTNVTSAMTECSVIDDK